MKKQTNKIKIIYFLKFFADALFMGYLAMYFATFFDRYSLEYGILLGVIPFCSLIGNYLWGLFSKNVQRNLLIIKIIGSLELLSLILFISLEKNFVVLLLLTILVSLFNSPYFSIQDGLGSSFSNKEGVKYNSIRILGSTGYLCALAFGAVLIKIFKEEYRYIFFIAALIYLTCIIIWFSVKPFDDLSSTEKTKVKYIEVLKNKYFILYFVAYILIIGGNNVADSYLYSRLSEVNISSANYSLVFASEILLEIIVSWVIIKFVNQKHYLLVLKISVLFMFLRAFLFGFNLPLKALIFVAPLRGIGWGGFISVHLITLRKIVSAKLVTKSISLLAVALSFVNGLFTVFGTSIYSQISLPGFYLLLSGAIFIGIIILYFIQNKYLKKDEQE